MKRVTLVWMLLSACVWVSAGDLSHRFATFNVRYVHPKNGDVGEKSWSARRLGVLATIRDYDFDIVGMQEVTGNNVDAETGRSQLEDLVSGLPGYACIAYERADKNYSYNVVFYKKQKYECLSHESFWLSETPDVCSKGFTAERERRCVVAHLRVKSTGETFWFCNTHPESDNAVAGEKSAQLIVDRLRRIAGAEPVVLVGDLNHKREQTAIYRTYRSFFEDAALTVASDSDYCVPRGGVETRSTYQSWKRAGECIGAEIDYLLYRGMTPLNRHIVTDTYGRDVPVSDHFALYGDFVLGEVVDAWRVTAARPDTGVYYGITSANGQIGLVSSRVPLQIDKLVVGGLYDVYGKEGVNNFFPNINPLKVRLWVNDEECTEETMRDHRQLFDLSTGTLHGSFTCRGVRIDYRILALRQLPFCYMMEVETQGRATLRLENAHEAPSSLHAVETRTKHIREKANPYVERYPEYDLLTTWAKSPTDRWTVAASTTVMQEGQRFTIVGSVMNSSFVPDAVNEAERLCVFARKEGRERLLAKHKAAWDELWKNDILIEGDAEAQQDVHSMLYHLYAFNREGSGQSCSPMGLSGLGYCGHAFWDADTWMFPALCVMQPVLARQMVDYRYERLEMARKKAYMFGYEGALFPWQSSYTGQEETAPHNMYPIAEHHISGDVAIAAWQYYELTHDKVWLREKGWPILRETATFWASRIEEENGRLVIKHVIGADEWGQNAGGGKIVDNNAYTIGVAKRNLEYATRAAKVVGEKAPAAWKRLADGLTWEKMPDGVIRLHDTYAGEITKQADVALLAYPLGLLTDTAEVRRNMEYYIDKVPRKRTPAMSKSIYSILYCRLHDADKALYYFRDSYLPNLNPPFRVIAEFDGGTNPYFLTGAGGTLQSLLFGFAGLQITDKGLKQTGKPVLPPTWKSLTIKTENGKLKIED